MNTYPKVAIIILNWNRKEDTIECLESLKQITYPNYDILLVDNGSTDGSVEYFRERYPGMEIIENGENLGFAEGNNVGIIWSIKKGVKYVLLLNNDTVVEPMFLSALVKEAENDLMIGFAGPKVYYYNYNGRTDVIHSAGAKIYMSRGTAPPIGLNEIDKGQYNEVRQVAYLEGACMLIKRDAIHKIGLLSPEYFMYWEETDWCVRANKAGLKIVYVPEAIVRHKKDARHTSKTRTYYQCRNMFLFMKKNATKKQCILFLFYFFVFQFWFMTGVIIIYQKNIGAFIPLLRGIRDGLKMI
jgi:GT2 family glycosyltransferase